MDESIGLSIGRLEGKVDMILAGQVVQATSITAVELRTTALEKWQSRLVGAAAVGGFITGIVLKVWT